MTPEELDEARAKEADRLWGEAESRVGELSALQVAARLARENWTPPEPEPVVDPDILAFREWGERRFGVNTASAYRLGDCDDTTTADAYLAGARMAREQERERAKMLLECLDNIQQFSGWVDGQHAARALAKYRGEA